LEPPTKRRPAEEAGHEGSAHSKASAETGTPGAAGSTPSAGPATSLSEEAQKLLDEFSALPDDGELLLQKLLSLAGPSPAAELAEALESGNEAAGSAAPAPGGAPGAETPASGAPAAEPPPEESYAAFGSRVQDGDYIVTEPDSRSVYVPVCPRGASESDLRGLFSQAGTVVSVQILRGQRGKRPSAVVEYDSKEAAGRAIPLLHRRWLRGEQLSVIPKRTRRRDRGDTR